MSAAELEVSVEDEAPIGSEDFAATAGITYRQLLYWVQQGFLLPANPEPGSGRALEWPEAELEIARRMGRLTAAGLPLSFAAAMARDTWAAGELSPGIFVTITDPEETT